MRNAVIQQFAADAIATDGPFSKVVRDATVKVNDNFSFVLADRLEEGLIQAGFAINHKEGRDHGQWVIVSADDATEYNDRGDNIVARAFSNSKEDALLQAIAAELREERLLLSHAAKLLTTNTELDITSDDAELLGALAKCHETPSLLTRELLVAVAGNKPLMAKLATL